MNEINHNGGSGSQGNHFTVINVRWTPKKLKNKNRPFSKTTRWSTLTHPRPSILGQAVWLNDTTRFFLCHLTTVMAKQERKKKCEKREQNDRQPCAYRAFPFQMGWHAAKSQEEITEPCLLFIAIAFSDPLSKPSVVGVIVVVFIVVARLEHCRKRKLRLN